MRENTIVHAIRKTATDRCEPSLIGRNGTYRIAQLQLDVVREWVNLTGISAKQGVPLRGGFCGIPIQSFVAFCHGAIDLLEPLRHELVVVDRALFEGFGYDTANLSAADLEYAAESLDEKLCEIVNQEVIVLAEELGLPRKSDAETEKPCPTCECHTLVTRGERLAGMCNECHPYDAECASCKAVGRREP